MNKVILIGRLVRDPELRYTQSQRAVCTFTLAVDKRLS
ncbi:MAG: single-stranded DNA-binding protein, partial [Anaerococcus prevotii]|nr:single-stranded DNA-binding protein [Anaerococcus prevotii]